MSFTDLITIAVGVDTSSAEEGLAGLAGAAEGIGDDIESRLSGASDSLQELGKRSSSTSRGIQGFAAVLALVDPRAAQAARAVGTLARGMSVLRLGLGPAAIAVTAVVAALALYQREQQRAADAMEAAKGRAENLKTALQGVADAARDIEDQIRLANGEIDGFGLAAEQQAESVRIASSAVVSAYDAEIAASKDTIDSLRQRAQAGENVTTALQQERTALSRLMGDREMEVERADRQIQTIELLAEFRRESREAAEREAEAERNLAESRRIGAERARERQRAEEELSSIIQSASEVGLSAAEKVIANYDQQLARANELADFLKNEEMRKEATSVLEAARDEELFQLLRRHQEDLADQRRRDHEEAMRQIEEDRQARLDSITAVGDLYGSLSGIARMVADERAKTDERAAQRALTVSKRLAVAEATASRAVGIQNAIARFAGRPVATALAIAAQVAGYAQQVAAIQGVTLHQGGTAPDETRAGGATLLRDERVLSPEASRRLGEEGARRLERGEEQMTTLRVVNTYQHFGLFFPGYVLGAPNVLTTTIKRGGTTGRTARY